MLVLRRAACSVRGKSHYIGVCRVCSTDFDVATSLSESGVARQSRNHFASPDSVALAEFSSGFLLSARPFARSRTLSSQAGKNVNSGKSDLEDGFSDLEEPNAADLSEDSDGIDTSLVSDVEEAATVVASTDDAGGKKVAQKKNFVSRLFDAVKDSPRHSISDILDKYVEDGLPMDRSEFAAALLQLRRRRQFFKALQLLDWIERKKCFDFVERDFASHLDLVAKVHGLHRAEMHIEKIPESFRGEIVYRTLLANCVSSNNTKKAEAVFNKIRDLGFPLTSFACNQLLLLYKRLDRKKIADVLLMMEKENIKPSIFTYKLLIDTKGRANDIEGMEQIVEAMKAEGTEPDSLIQSMVANYYIYGGYKEKAEAILKEMERRVGENRRDLKFLLPLYASLDKADEVERIWKVCEANPTLEEGLAAIEAWGRLKHTENAEAIFELMAQKWKRLSSRYYNALLKIYTQQKLLAKGKEFAKRMSTDGCHLGPSTWDILVKLYLNSGEVEKADFVLHKAMEQNQMKPLYSSYLAILEKYAKRGDIHNAEKIFHKLRMSGYAGRMRMYQELLEAYVNAKAPAYGFRERMKADNIFPNNTLAGQLKAVDAFKNTHISELFD